MPEVKAQGISDLKEATAGQITACAYFNTDVGKALELAGTKRKIGHMQNVNFEQKRIRYKK
jgi:hypothetical protein